MTSEAADRPHLRGVSHAIAFFLAVAAGIVLAILADGGRETFAAWVYGAALAAMFGASALYHRFPWSTDTSRRWARRVDHSTIFLFIAGTYTPFALLAFEGATRWLVLGFAWGGAVVGLALNLAWIDAPRWLSAGAYLAVGWVGVLAAPQILANVGIAGTVLVAVGGALYTIGAVTYALKRPNPFPRWFGFHEIFHLLVIAAAVVQFIAVALLVL
ncbi:MAG: hemolysin III family protein [Gaiellales bacterium]